MDLSSTKKIWENTLNRIERDNETQDVKVLFDKQELLGFAERHYLARHKTGATWNGRQIRNAFQTAIALGHYDRLRKLEEAGLIEEDGLRSGDARHRAASRW